MSESTGASALPVRHVLWTGGWDSTFRILQLLFESNDVVAPVYLVSPNRRSVRHELRAMNAISSRARQRDHTFESRLLPTRLVEKERIPGNAAVTGAFRRCLSEEFIGPQFEYLSRFVRGGSIQASLELCLDKGSRAHMRLKPHLVRVRDGVYALADEIRESDLGLVFGGMEFPLLDFTKTDMRVHAKKGEYLDILDRSWFCHEPIGSSPCGICSPCEQVMRSGMVQRLPWRARLRYHVSVSRRVRGWHRLHTPATAD